MASIEVFQIATTLEDNTDAFTHALLSSSDYTAPERKHALREGKVVSGNKRTEQASAILRASQIDTGTSLRKLMDALVVGLITRKKFYFALKVGTVSKTPQLADPKLLLKQRGEPIWYGPIARPEDTGAVWYIRPVLLTYHVVNETETGQDVIESKLRWLCLARVTNNVISLHWRNFTPGSGRVFVRGKPYSSRFPYWLLIPYLFAEIEKHCGAKVREVALDNLILNTIWDQYHDSRQFRWEDIHVKAEHSGITLNARRKGVGIVLTRGSDEDDDFEPQEDINTDSTEIEGIKNFASTVRKAVVARLRSYEVVVKPNIAEELDKEILRTMIKNYHPQFYQCAIQNRANNDLLFYGKAYFAENDTDDEEGLRHVQLTHNQQISDLDQLLFLLAHFDADKHLVPQTSPNISQGSFFDFQLDE